MKWLTFDCFGTLVDWHAGFGAILDTIARGRTAELLAHYHRLEPQLEARSPAPRYRDVLTQGTLNAARAIGLRITADEAAALPERWAELTVFPDVEPMLARLRADNWRLAVLTNCDDDLFAVTQRAFALPFDAVVTAEQVGSYKPGLAHFNRFQARFKPDQWMHVACSWFHDIAPARQLGIPRIWLDRDNTGEDPGAASLRVTSAQEVPDAVRRLA